jgi:hypothetical protein
MFGLPLTSTSRSPAIFQNWVYWYLISCRPIHSYSAYLCPGCFRSSACAKWDAVIVPESVWELAWAVTSAPAASFLISGVAVSRTRATTLPLSRNCTSRREHSRQAPRMRLAIQPASAAVPEGRAWSSSKGPEGCAGVEESLKEWGEGKIRSEACKQKEGNWRE